MKATASDKVGAGLSRRSPHNLTTDERAARARDRDLRQLRALRAERDRELELLQAEISKLDAQTKLAQSELDAATAKL